VDTKRLARLGACLLCSVLISCGGSDSGSSGSATSSPTSNGQLNIVPETVTLSKGASKEVLFELAGSQGLVNQTVYFRVSEPTLAHIAPSSCVLSSGLGQASPCMLTVTGRATGTVRVFADADGYEGDFAQVTVTSPNPYGSLSVTPSSAAAQVYWSRGQAIPFAITVQFSPGSGGQIIPQSNPLYVSMNQPAGSPLTFTVQQCALWTASPTCIISGTLDGTKAPSIDFTSTISVVGAWQAPPEAPFGPADNMTVTWRGTAEQQAGRITVASQNGSNQVYTGMKAPLFVNLTENTLTTSSYSVTLTSNDPSTLVFYAFDDGNNTSPGTMTSVTCKLSLDNTSPQTIANSTTNCGYGLYPQKAGAVSLAVAVTGSSTPADAALPSYASTVNLLVQDASQLSSGRTVTFANNSLTDTVVVNANSGTANAFISPTSVASGSAAANLAKSVADAQSRCGWSNPSNACPIGSTCVQGGQNVIAGKDTPFYCYWDAPQFTSATQTVPANKVPPNSSASLFIPSWSGITAGNQQVQWSGNYYVVKCENSNSCPPSPTRPGTGSTYAAQTLAEVTYQHNAVDYYDVSIINGANYALQFGPKASEMTPSTTTAYTCGTAGSMTAMSGNQATNPSGYLPASSWAFSPSTANFPSGTSITDSPSSYYAVVNPSSATPTSCTVQADCSGGATSGPRCGWDYTKAPSGTSPFSSRVCGTFYSWATANQIHGWNMTASNVAPFSLQTASAVVPAFKLQSTVSVGDLQLCVNNTYSAYTNPAPANKPDASVNMSTALACGGTNWSGITRPSVVYTTQNPNWVAYVLPTINWLKTACPTCYTFPYDDMSSTFTCDSSATSASGSNVLDYTVKVNDLSNTFN